MSPKEYLMQIRYLDKEINTKLRLLDDLKAKAYSIGNLQAKEKVQSSGGLNFSDWIDRLVDQEIEINKKINKLITLKILINNQIDNINNSLYRMILVNHYVLSISLLDIADGYNYSYSYVKKMHGLALLEFEKCNKEIFK